MALFKNYNLFINYLDIIRVITQTSLILPTYVEYCEKTLNNQTHFPINLWIPFNVDNKLHQFLYSTNRGQRYELRFDLTTSIKPYIGNLRIKLSKYCTPLYIVLRCQPKEWNTLLMEWIK